jgi:all-trans-8'-apo-beta-carotenal 15,15'-oxygenase
MIQSQIAAQQSSQESSIREGWLRGYESQPDEYSYWVDEIEGKIPAELEGTLFRNGPGLLKVGDLPVYHPFDADGMVCAITFTKGRVHFRNRFVRTEGYLKEQKAGTILDRGLFGTQKPGGWLKNAFKFKLKNVANINVLHWGKKLLALWDLDNPYSLDPATLDTLGLDSLNGLLKPGEQFSAHPLIDPSCHLDGGKPCLVNFSLKTNYASQIKLYELDLDGKLLRCHTHRLPGLVFMHDFAITPNYCIFVQNPVSFNVLPFILGWRGLANCIKFHPKQATRIVAIPRTPPYKKIKTFKVPSIFSLHNVNAFEVENQLVLDAICYEAIPQVLRGVSYYDGVDFDSPIRAQLWRFLLDLETSQSNQFLLDEHCSEYPVIHPDRVGRKHRYIYMAAVHDRERSAPLQAIIKLDCQTRERQFRSFAPQGYTVEPMFVPRPGATAEDDGWVLVVVYDASRHRSDVVILDAQDLHREIARVSLKLHIPHGFHGHWSNSVFI